MYLNCKLVNKEQLDTAQDSQLGVDLGYLVTPSGGLNTGQASAKWIRIC